MEEKESTVSGSLGNSDTDSPPAPLSNVALPQVVLNRPGDMSLAVTTTTATTSTMLTSTSTTPGSAELFGKKKRGRPRKYDADGNLRLSYIVPPPPGFTLSPSSPPEFSSKRGRGRPSGSGNWQLLASLGGDFTPHVVTVNTGEDVAGRILSFSQKSLRGICILSANGAVSNVTIRQPGSSGGILTYEGRFEILSLSGSFTVTDTGGKRSRTGGLSISLAGPDGRVIGGGIAGLLVAAGPIQIVVGSFMPNGYKAHKKKYHREQTMLSPISGAPDMLARSITPTKLEGSLFNPVELKAQNNAEAEADNGVGVKLNANATQNTAIRNGSEPTSDQRPSPDINVSAFGE
ncbi:AT-hook motif nuclear-localized protein 1-like isoform X2 [Juglans microcarpa x Juglans regia]|uniref:AT-hook motif nuclear-localized protein 1-like isoform X2 n=1 Tax=Juglans microcarpa x Juglans regia TaxID=2249226 RepID=UPI001B7E76AF|nr:AT-hook motif nuclear-localized protein 1-like isoform X2 [Juglans microcarpa x Juglans regia]